MKTYCIFILFSFWTIGLFGQTEFKHDWDTKYLEHSIQFTSKKIAPKPFSNSGEPQAIMFVGASKLDPSSENDLNQIVKDEIASIMTDICIDEYLEDDYTPEDNIVSYFEMISSVKIGIIKYRTCGEKGEPKVIPRSVRQILLIKNDKLYISSLIVLYAEDQDNLRSDQMTFIKQIINQ